MSTEQDNKCVVSQMIETFNEGDLDALMSYYADESINHGFPVKREDIRRVLEDIRGTFPDVMFEPKRVVAEGEWVVVYTRFRGTHLGVGRLPVNGGALVGVPPTGKRFNVDHIHMWRIQNGQIVEHNACRDDMEMMRQLEMAPAA